MSTEESLSLSCLFMLLSVTSYHYYMHKHRDNCVACCIIIHVLEAISQAVGLKQKEDHIKT